MSATVEFTLNAYGQKVTGFRIPIGSTVNWNLTCLDDQTRAALDLTGDVIKSSLCAFDNRRQPVLPPIFTRQASITDAAHGLALIPWASGDTVPGGVPLTPGRYFVDFWHVAASGNQELLLTLEVELTAVGTLPDALVSSLPSQEPIGKGDKGDQGSGLTSLSPFTTIDATPHDFTIDSPTTQGVYFYSFLVKAQNSNGVLAHGWHLETWVNVDSSGTVTVLGEPAIVDDESEDNAVDHGWTVAVVIVGGAVVVEVSGASIITTWRVKYAIE